MPIKSSLNQLPNLLTIPSGYDFLDSLAESLFQSGFLETETKALVLLPTKRSVRVLSQNLLEKSKNKIVLYPKLQTLADIEEEENEGFFESEFLEVDLPPAISDLQRKFELSILIKAREEALGNQLTSVDAIALTQPLIDLMDEMDREEISDLSMLDKELKAFLPIHLSRAADFLEIINRIWPERLKELGMMNPVARRMKTLSILAEIWETSPPDYPIIAAGSTASIPATAKILSVIAGLPKGCVVFPGFDLDIDQKAWNAIDIQHPQMSMKNFLEQAGFKKEDVKLFPVLSPVKKNNFSIKQEQKISPFWLKKDQKNSSFIGSKQEVENSKKQTSKRIGSDCFFLDNQDRRKLINEALRPAKTTQAWQARLKVFWEDKERKQENQQTAYDQQNKASIVNALKGLSLVTAPTEEKEAFVIALALREVIETKEQTAILVTSEISLAKRVQAYLQRWNVSPDSSFGEHVFTSLNGSFFLALLDWILAPLSPLCLLNLLQNSLARFDLKEPIKSKLIQFLDAHVLRGAVHYQTYQDLKSRLNLSKSNNVELNESAFSLFDFLDQICQELSSFKTENSITNYTHKFAEIAEKIAGGSEDSDRLWQTQSGIIFSEGLREVLEKGAFVNLQSWYEYQKLITLVFQEKIIPTSVVTEKRIQILGVWEARLMSADLVIISGLNEGVWPQKIKEDPFLSYTMRKVVGLSVPEKRLGLMAHDFVQLVSLPEVLLTRSMVRDNNPVLASRWLWRLNALISGILGNSKIDSWLYPKTDYLSIAFELDRVEKDKIQPALPPNPCPPSEARWPLPKGRRLSASEFKTFVRDPYAIYANRILALKRLEPLNKAPKAAEWGSIVHECLESFIEDLIKNPKLSPDFFKQDIKTYIEMQSRHLYQNLCHAFLSAGFSKSRLAFESKNLKKSIKAFISWQLERQKLNIYPLGLELKGIYQCMSVKKTPFNIHIRADRLDISPNGIDILDYKTGRLPTLKQIKAGLDLQLPFAIAVLSQGGFLIELTKKQADFVQNWMKKNSTPDFIKKTQQILVENKNVQSDVQDNSDQNLSSDLLIKHFLSFRHSVLFSQRSNPSIRDSNVLSEKNNLIEGSHNDNNMWGKQEKSEKNNLEFLLQEKNIKSNQEIRSKIADRLVHQIFYLAFSSGEIQQKNMVSMFKEEKNKAQKPLTPDQAIQLVDRVVSDWINAFDHSDKPYQSQIHAENIQYIGDYDHLARRKEWYQGSFSE